MADGITSFIPKISKKRQKNLIEAMMENAQTPEEKDALKILNVRERWNDDLTLGICANFMKNPRLNPRWTALPTSSPLLFEDLDYLQLLKHHNIDNRLTDRDHKLWKEGKLRTVYSSIEQMMLCNFKYFDRILATAMLLRFGVFKDNRDNYWYPEDERETDYLKHVRLEIFLTPTQLYYASLIDVNITCSELEFAFSLPQGYLERRTKEDKENGIISDLQKNFNKLMRIGNFRAVVAIHCERWDVTNFFDALYLEKMDNNRMGQISRKFTRLTRAVSEQQLNTVHEYVENINLTHNKLYRAIDKALAPMFDNDPTKYAIFVFNDEFVIYTERFTMRVMRDLETGKITKEYLSNSVECFKAESFLFNSMREQLEWAKHKEPMVNEFDKITLRGILESMLVQDFKNVVCIKRCTPDGAEDEDKQIVSKITFSGIFKHVKIKETFMMKNKVIRETTKVLSKFNAAKYIINRGYYYFGFMENIPQMYDSSQKTLIDLYSMNTQPIWEYMQPWQSVARKHHSDMIDVLIVAPDFHVLDNLTFLEKEEARKAGKLSSFFIKSEWFDEQWGYSKTRLPDANLRLMRNTLSSARMKINKKEGYDLRQKGIFETVYDKSLNLNLYGGNLNDV